MLRVKGWGRRAGALGVVGVLALGCTGRGGDSSSSSSSSSSGGGGSSVARSSSSMAGSGGSSVGGSSTGGSSVGGSSAVNSSSRPASSVGGSSGVVGSSSTMVSSSRPLGSSSGVVGSSSAGGSSGVVVSSSAGGGSSSGVVVSSSAGGGSSSGVVVSSSAGGGSSSGVVVSSSAGGGSSGVVVSSSAGGSSSSGGPVCGNQFLEAGEQCDDGNATAGDGCNACVAEPGFSVEVEPNNTRNFADSLIPFHTRSGTISPTNDQDFFMFVPGVTTHVRIETFNADGTVCIPGVTDTVVELQDSTGTVLATNDDGPPAKGRCSLLDPDVDATGLAVTAGQTYYVHVFDFSNDGVIPNYRIRISLRETQGNNNDFASAAGLGLFAPLAVGDINPVGDLDVLGIQLGTVGDVAIYVTDGSLVPGVCPQGIDLQMSLLDGDGSVLGQIDDPVSGTTCPYMDANTTVTQASQVGHTVMRGIGPRYRRGLSTTSSNYYVQVRHLFNSQTADNYFVRAVYTSVCGDMQQTGSERCDTGAESLTCTRACEQILDEAEPNNSVNLADPIDTRQVRRGAIGVIGDVDHYRFVVPAEGGRYQFWTTEADGTYTTGCAGLDSVVDILDTSSNVLFTNDDSGNSCSFVDTGLLAQGTYYVRVTRFSNSAVTSVYQLHMDYAH